MCRVIFMAEKNRIWELDAFRGLCIIGVVIVHTIYDLQMFGMMSYDTPTLFNIIRDYGGLLFVLMSGICVTLGHHSFRRGIIVFLCGMVITGVTYGMFFFDMAGEYILIHFGVLHLLGICMMFYSLYKHLPTWAVALMGIAIVVLSFVIKDVRSESFMTIPLGIMTRGYMASDYFPLIPNLGWFMLGTVLGRIVYDKKTSLLPKVPHKNAPVRFLSFCGRHSLWIYMGHQPIVYGVVYLLYSFSNK